MAIRTPVVALIGRPNVGKSTLFNRIVGKKLAVVEDFPGVTRDRNYALVERYAVPFYIVDTGGFETEIVDTMQDFVREQVKVAIEEADVIFCLFDGRAGLAPGDHEVVELLRSAQKPIYWLVNKCDGAEQEALSSEFYALGIEEVIPVSAQEGRNVKGLITRMLEDLPNYQALVTSFAARKEQEEQRIREAEAAMRKALEEGEEFFEDEEAEDENAEEEFIEEEPTFAPVYVPSENETKQLYDREYRLRDLPASVARITDDDDETPIEEVSLDLIRVAIIGRPNVGKSTFLNKILGETRAITSPEAGTTRDSLDVPVTRDGQDYLLIDTAGIRKKARVTDNIEKYSVFRSLQAIATCDVAVLLLDASAGPVEQDAKVLGIAHEEGKGVVIAVNKWDLIEKDHKSVTKYQQEIRDVFKFTPYAPLLFISALSGQRCPKVLQVAKAVAEERAKRVPTGRLNKVLKQSIARHNPPVYRGHTVKLYYGAQITTSPPRFALFFNYPKAVHFSYQRYLKNSIRDEFGFEGTDIKLSLRKR